MLRAIFFDFGGVVWATPGKTFYAALCARLGVDYDRFHQLFKAHEPALKAGRMTTAAFASIAERTFGLRQVIPLWEEVYREHLTVRDGILDLATSLKARCQVGLLSNQIDITARLNRASGLFAAFDPIVISCEVGLRKPELAIFRRAAQMAGCAPSACMLVDDSETNVAAARAAGMQAILFEDEAALRRDLADRGLIKE
ncbi:MAG: HAD-IA family hydrolase [Candidatus Aenigmarchaeota archaeon]|nr:HAD-IA family hydrolase [Candidatus Aenigmarchaeota archaeon]